MTVPFYMGMRVIRSKDVPVTGQQPQQEVRLLRHGNRRGGHRPTSRPPL
jgi:hypothetical protein